MPVKKETGRYTQIPLEFRLFILCDSNLVEDENHFLFQCHFYYTLRDQFFQKVKDLYPEFDVMNNNLKLKNLMSEMLLKDIEKESDFHLLPNYYHIKYTILILMESVYIDLFLF